MISRTVLAAIVVIAVLHYYRDRDDVPAICVALVAGSIVGHVFFVRMGNLLPFVRAWLIGGSIAAFVYPLDLARTDAYDAPTGMSYVAAFVGCMIAGMWSLKKVEVSEAANANSPSRIALGTQRNETRLRQASP